MTWKRLTALVVAVAGTALLIPTVSRTDNEGEIDSSVRRAVKYLRSNRSGNSWQYLFPVTGHNVGLTSLCTLALLAAGESKDDPVVAAAAKYVRDNAPAVQQSSTNTYGLSLAIVLLDQYYNEPAVDSLIQQLTVQLVAGQNPRNGGWTYDCRPLTADQYSWWRSFLDKNRHSRPPDDPQHNQAASGVVDNSNTQFAILALWIGRRHGVHVTYPLLLAERRFRRSQQGSGAWNYGAEAGGSQAETMAMTCAGLIGLAFGYSAASEAGIAIARSGKQPDANAPEDTEGTAPRSMLDRDEQVAKAKRFLVEQMQRSPASAVGNSHYTLWSLERTCLLHNWTKDMNGFDWYQWGAQTLLQTQAQDGSWISTDIHTGTLASTAFAILFLKRANFTADANRILVKSGNFKEETRKGGGKPGKNGPNAANNNSPSAPAVPPPPPADAEAKKLRDVVVQGGGRPQEDALKKLRDTPGKEYTTALLEAVKQTSGGLQNQLRDTLAERLIREEPKELRRCLTSDERELQMAAAWAAALKSCKEMVPEIIALLGSTDDKVSNKAVEALKVLSVGEDYGKSADKWKAWWERYKKANPSAK
jgi:hypothetical protein